MQAALVCDGTENGGKLTKTYIRRRLRCYKTDLLGTCTSMYSILKISKYNIKPTTQGSVGRASLRQPGGRHARWISFRHMSIVHWSPEPHSPLLPARCCVRQLEWILGHGSTLAHNKKVCYIDVAKISKTPAFGTERYPDSPRNESSKTTIVPRLTPT